MSQREQEGEVSEGSRGTGQATASPIRIAILAMYAIQYCVPYYRALAALPGVQAKVFFSRKWGAEAYYDRDFGREVKWDLPLLEGYEWELLEMRGDPNARGFWAVSNVNTGSALERFHPDVVEISGYMHRTMLQTLFWCNRNRVPVIMSSDSNLNIKRAWWKAAAKALAVKQVYRRLDGVFANGDNNRAYHVFYGAPSERIFERPLPVDCRALVASAGDVLETRRAIRRQYAIPEDAFVVVFAGKLSEWKCPLHLLQAIDLCAQQGHNVWALVVGEGNQRGTLENYLRDRRLTNAVLAGFVNQSAIAKYFAASDVLALMSSYEPKGQVVPEAGSLGCPSILSDRVGCIGPNDCARPGENALIYPWSDISAFAQSIVTLHQDRDLFRSMSAAAVRIAWLQDASVAAAKMEQTAQQLQKIGCRR